MVAAVVRGDAIIAQGAAGVRKRGDPTLVTIDDKFHLGSCTKAMTATMIATLVEEGKLKWDSTLEETFPEHRDRMKPVYRTVTLQQLLTHHAGIPTADVGGWYDRVVPMKDMLAARELILDAVTTHDPDAPPGTQCIYANAGYIIAAHMAEKVTGKTWEELMHERLFDPLGMKSVAFGAPAQKGKVDQPLGHGIAGLPADFGHAADNPLAMGPAGTVHCTIGDWAKFVILHLQAETGNARLLKPETFATLHRPGKAKLDGNVDYAMGWMVFGVPSKAGATLMHAGSNTFWFCNVWIDPKRDAAILVMCNQGPPLASGAADAVLTKMIARFAPDSRSRGRGGFSRRGCEMHSAAEAAPTQFPD